MKLSDFDYIFPKELIAYRPMMRRDSSRLLVVDRPGSRIQHRRFADLPQYLKKDDCLVLNDTRVMPVALTAALNDNGSARGADILILQKIAPDTAACLVKPAKKFKKDTKIYFADKTTATVVRERPNRILRFSCPIDKLLKKEGRMPLPPYIKRQSDRDDFRTYQTVYAKRQGAVAAPTAGLHFTKDILKEISDKGAKTAHVTLHVGYGTFKPVRVENIAEHQMHKEWFSVSQATIDLINKTKNSGGKILAVGTTSCRVLETVAQPVRSRELGVGSKKLQTPPARRAMWPGWVNSKLLANTGYTDLFIYPPYQFKLTDMLLTNFHLPKTTLLMLVSAFCGHDLMMRAYKEAIEKRYRLFSYGDAMLII